MAGPLAESLADPLPCERAEVLARRFAAGSLPAAQAARLRAHVRGCDGCRAAYREAVDGAAGLARHLRRERQAAARALRRLSLRQDVLEAGAPRPRRGGRWRVLLYPALMSLLLVQLGRLGERSGGPRLEPLAGVVRAAGSALAVERALGQGEWCATGPAGRARLATRRASAVLGPDTRLVVERAGRLRLRLAGGALELEGELAVTSAHGVVELAGGAATLALDGTGLEVACSAGSARCVGPGGVRELVAGQRARLERAAGDPLGGPPAR